MILRKVYLDTYRNYKSINIMYMEACTGSDQLGFNHMCYMTKNYYSFMILYHP